MKTFAPAAERNRGPILEVLRTVLPPSGLVLEVASGTGQHVACFAAALPDLIWQPSDLDPQIASIEAWVAEGGLGNVRPVTVLDVRKHAWPIERADALVCANLIHIAPWSATEGLFAGGARLLPPEAPLVLYGPFAFGGRFTSVSNAEFDASLRARDARWGVRDLDAVQGAAAGHGFDLDLVVPRPANNHVIVFRRGG